MEGIWDQRHRKLKQPSSVLSGPVMCVSGQERGRRSASLDLIIHSGEQWKNTVDKAVWSQPVEGLGFQDKGFGLDPGGSGSQRRLGKGVDLMKEFLIR